jgi:hypothetical protein
MLTVGTVERIAIRVYSQTKLTGWQCVALYAVWNFAFQVGDRKRVMMWDVDGHEVISLISLGAPLANFSGQLPRVGLSVALKAFICT